LYEEEVLNFGQYEEEKNVNKFAGDGIHIKA